MRRSGLHASFWAVVGALAALFSAPSAAAPGPAACRGRDLLGDIAATQAGAVQRIDNAAHATVNSEAMLWRIARPGTTRSYIFGTVHLSDERVTHLPPAVERALAASNRLVLEIADLSPHSVGAALGRLGDKLIFRDGRSLRTLLSSDELPAAENAARKAGLPVQLVEVVRPWLVTMLLALSDCERDRVQAGHKPLDLQLGDMARERGLPVLGLESIDDQLAAMAAVPEDDQLTVLKASIKLLPAADDLVETMLQRYLAREIAKIWPLQVELWRKAGFDERAFASFQRELVSVRNGRMRDAALPLLANGGAFIAVGALHLIGKDGLVALLREAGYEVTPAERPPFGAQ